MDMHIESRGRAAGRDASTSDRLLEAALAKPNARVAWICPTHAMASHRARQMTVAFAEEGRRYTYRPMDLAIRLHNGSEIIFVAGDPRSVERLRGFNLAAAAALPGELRVDVSRMLAERLRRGGGELIR
jgi:hypothetical protein